MGGMLRSLWTFAIMATMAFVLYGGFGAADPGPGRAAPGAGRPTAVSGAVLRVPLELAATGQAWAAAPRVLPPRHGGGRTDDPASGDVFWSASAPPATPARVIPAALPGEGTAAPRRRDPAFAVAFAADAEVLDPGATPDLVALAAELQDSAERIRLIAYAGEPGDRTSATKRRALRRALAVRAFLTERGISETRIDVLAAGPADSGARDRVDVVRPQS